MESVSTFKIEKANESRYIAIHKIHFKQNDKPRIWDTVFQHDSVSVLIHHTERDTFLFVKQFRPAVYIQIALDEGQDRTKVIDTNKTPPSKGCTYELCAGIVDKDLSLVDIAKEEVLEEVGYNAPVETFEKIITTRSVGISGCQQTMFYVPVTESMKVSNGGGNIEEGEIIEVIEVPVKDSYTFIMDETKVSPAGMALGVMWFLQNKV